jgi:hypothetical protein
MRNHVQGRGKKTIGKKTIGKKTIGKKTIGKKTIGKKIPLMFRQLEIEISSTGTRFYYTMVQKPRL